MLVPPFHFYVLVTGENKVSNHRFRRRVQNPCCGNASSLRPGLQGRACSITTEIGSAKSIDTANLTASGRLH